MLLISIDKSSLYKEKKSTVYMNDEYFPRVKSG